MSRSHRRPIARCTHRRSPASIHSTACCRVRHRRCGSSRTTARSRRLRRLYVNKPTPTHRIDITATVKADDGRVVFTNTEERSSEELHGTPGGFGYAARIPHQGMGAGTLRADDRGEVTSQRCRAGVSRHSVRGEIDERIVIAQSKCALHPRGGHPFGADEHLPAWPRAT